MHCIRRSYSARPGILRLSGSRPGRKRHRVCNLLRDRAAERRLRTSSRYLCGSRCSRDWFRFRARRRTCATAAGTRGIRRSPPGFPAGCAPEVRRLPDSRRRRTHNAAMPAPCRATPRASCWRSRSPSARQHICMPPRARWFWRWPPGAAGWSRGTRCIAGFPRRCRRRDRGRKPRCGRHRSSPGTWSAWYVAHTLRISSGLRGNPRLVPGRPGTIRGASQKAFHFSRSITSGVSCTFSSCNGAICCCERRRTPLVISISGLRFRPRTIQLPALLRAASSCTDGCPPRRAKRARSSSRRSPCHVSSSVPASNLRLQPFLGLVAGHVAREFLARNGSGRQGRQYQDVLQLHFTLQIASGQVYIGAGRHNTLAPHAEAHGPAPARSTAIRREAG